MMPALQQRLGDLVALHCCFALLLPLLCHGADIPLGSTLSPGTSASWSSPNDTFRLSFTPSATSPSLFVAAITYAGGVPVWSAGAGAAVDSGGSLRLSSSGDLELINGSGAVLWSSMTGGKGVTAASVEESGNLVLKNSKHSTVWQSFDHPTDTLVMSQKFTSRMNLTSGPYVFAVDKSSGNLTLRWWTTSGANTVTYFNKGYVSNQQGIGEEAPESRAGSNDRGGRRSSAERRRLEEEDDTRLFCYKWFDTSLPLPLQLI